MIAIGVGCRRGATKEAIAALVNRARLLASVANEDIILFSHERKRDELGLLAAADELGLPLQFLSSEAMQAVEDRVVTISPYSKKALGISSVSEAAALAGAGPGARLLLHRIVGEGVTSAIARGQSR